MNEFQKAIALTILPQISEAASNPFLRATNKNHQLGLFTPQPQPPLLSKRPTDSSHHGRRGYYFQLIGCDGRQYGGLYLLAEADEILASFRGHRGEVSAREFGSVAERVIKATATGRAA